MAVSMATERIAAEARECGFPLAGAAPLGVLERAPFVERWLAEGRAGEMGYLARRMAERMDPRTAFPWARSIVSLAYPYRSPPRPAGDWRARGRGRPAPYAPRPRHHQRGGAALQRLVPPLRDPFSCFRLPPPLATQAL